MVHREGEVVLNVALTGNIASGKSSVGEIWRRHGARVIESDVLARVVVRPGTRALHRIVDRWGIGILSPSGELDRAALRDIVFRDPNARAALEEIVHPAIERLRREEIIAAEAAGEAVVVSDIPLLFEAGLERDYDLVVFVDAPEEIRRQRLVTLRGLEPGEADRMIAAQSPSGPKRAHADIVIDNDGSLVDLDRRASEAWATILERAGAETSG